MNDLKLTSIIPETFELDIERIVSVSLLFHQLVSTASLLAYFQQTVKIHTGHKAEEEVMEELKHVLNILLSQEDKGVKDISEEMCHRLKIVMRNARPQQSPSNVETAIGQMEDKVQSVLVDSNCPVYTLIQNRLIDLLTILAMNDKEAILSSTKKEQEIEEAFRKRGLIEFKEFINDRLLPLLAKILKHNQDVHADNYDRIIREQIESVSS